MKKAVILLLAATLLLSACQVSKTPDTGMTTQTTMATEPQQELTQMEKMELYLQNNCTNIAQSGMTKNYYAEVTAQCLAEYDRINPLETATVKELSDTLQAYSRVLCSMAVLIDYSAENDITCFAQKYETGLFASKDGFRALFARMMRAGCEAAIQYAGKDVENFSVKELAIAYHLAAPHFDAAETAIWAESLQQVQPDKRFYSHANMATNRNAYAMAGEQLRAHLGLGDGTQIEQFIDSSLTRQLSHFDDNGMYRDNYGEAYEIDPTLYDLTTRVQLQLVTGFGYDGEYAQELDTLLKNGGIMTLFTTSANGELTYGGRSNQYIFNAALISANCEYEAVRYARQGNAALAGAFKRTAHKAILSIGEYLRANKHIMNYYSGTKVGTEDYGYYDKYMVTMSSFLSIAYLFADDTIAETAAPMETGGYVVETSEYFNGIVAAAGDYSIQILTKADSHYDSVGLGRIHKAGVYSALGLSMPITETPIYTAPPNVELLDLSLCPGWYDEGILYRLSELNNLDHTLEIIQEMPERVEFVLTYTGHSLLSCDAVQEHYVLTKDGLQVTVTLQGYTGDSISYTVPLFATNGDGDFAGQSTVEAVEKGFAVSMNGQTYRVTSNADNVLLGDDHYGNRNGEYRLGTLEKAGNTITVSFALE